MLTWLLNIRQVIMILNYYIFRLQVVRNIWYWAWTFQVIVIRTYWLLITTIMLWLIWLKQLTIKILEHEVILLSHIDVKLFVNDSLISKFKTKISKNKRENDNYQGEFEPKEQRARFEANRIWKKIKWFASLLLS